MTQWQDKTRGGHQYRITGRDPEFKNLIRGEVDDSGLTIPLYWTEGGRISVGTESPYDLIPIEAEAPSPAKVRVDLALAAHSLRTAVVEFERAKDAKSKAREALSDFFVTSGKTEVVVKIDGDHYYFWAGGTGAFFRKIEVL